MCDSRSPQGEGEENEAIDDVTVRIHTKTVFPAALEYLAMALPIWPKAYRERVGADEYAKQPIGAGPYRITRIDGVREIDLERFDDYYPDSPKGRPAIRRIAIKEVPEEATQITMLLATKPTGSGISTPTTSTTSTACRRCRQSAPSPCATV